MSLTAQRGDRDPIPISVFESYLNDLTSVGPRTSGVCTIADDAAIAGAAYSIRSRRFWAAQSRGRTTRFMGVCAVSSTVAGRQRSPQRCRALETASGST